MKSSILAIAASIFRSAAAGQHREPESFHDQLLEARDVIGTLRDSTCACSTTYATHNGEPTLVQPIEYRAAATSVQAALNIPIPIATSSQSSTPTASSTSSTNSASSTLTHHPLTSSGTQWCMTYSPYHHDGTCKSPSAVATDVSSIASKGFTSIRLYSPDCSGLSSVGAATSSHNLSLVLGIYIPHEGIPAARDQIAEITTWATSTNSWPSVEMIVVGNEAVFNNYCTPTALAAFVSHAKTAFKAAGYNGPVTTTEPLSVLVQHAETLCPVLDLAAANIHPFFNSAISASDAGAFVASELAILARICPGLEAYNLETGWPSSGQANGKAIPGIREQEVAIRGIVERAGGRSAVFSFGDEMWKEEGDFGVERSWGAGHLFGV